MIEVHMTYNVDIHWDDEANVWYATSEDIIGLTLESENLDLLVERVKTAAPELLELNNQAPATRINCRTHERQLVYA